MKNTLSLLLLLVAALSVAFLYAQEEAAPPVQEEEVPAPPKETVLEDAIRSLVHGNNAFAYALYSQLKGETGNLFFSPYCINSAMAIPYTGAKSGTQSQMQAALHYLPQTDNLDLAIEEFNKRLSKPTMQGPNEIRLLMANGLWVQRNYQLEADFLEKIKRYFGATLRQADFIRNADAARLNINEWVREGTQGRITNIVAKGDISSDTRLVVVSSIFMKAVWEFPFDATLTIPSPFFIDPKTTVSVPMMQLTKRLRIMQHPQFTLLELPYSSGFGEMTKFDMYIMLPNSPGGLNQVENLAATGDLDDWVKSLQTEQVIVSLPRYKFTSAFDLSTALKQLGMPAAFTDLADFTGIYAGGGLFLSKVLHKAYVSVDEKGTEAVAATAISINTTAIQEENPPVVFKADHPFVFIIVERSTGAILFMGRFSTPTN